MFEHRVQKLLYPHGKTIADTAIFMPQTMRDGLHKLFSFAPSGDWDLEGDAFLKGFREFGEHVQEQNLCRISRYFYNEALGDGSFLEAITPIDKALETAYFINDQLSDNPEIRTIVPVGIKHAVETHDPRKDDLQRVEDRDTLGWFDLEGPAMIFFNSGSLGRKVGYVFDLIDLPCVDENLNYVMRSGRTVSEQVKKMELLAQAWKTNVVCKKANDFEIKVTPSLEVIRTPVASYVGP